MPDDPLESWLTKAEAAAALRVSEKTIERMATKGQLHRETRRRTGVRPQPVFNPQDIEALKTQQGPEPFVVPESEQTPKPNRALAPVRPDFGSFLQAFSPAGGVPLKDKLFLNVKEAAQYAGLPLSTIRRLIAANKLKAIKAGGWRIKRSDLESLDLQDLSD